MSRSHQHSAEPEPEFKGYPAPTSNTTYTPNQFFDVVLPHSSRGCVRLVAYMIRKTLGWSDADGNPQEPQVVISYNQLIREAGISRGAISPTLDEATQANFIRCVRRGRPSKNKKSAVSALFELCWDERDEYVKDPAEFEGFYAGNGNLTYIPNAFFDYTVPNEPLAVIKIVGAVIRYTIGFQTKYGFRRQKIDMSFTRLQRITGISSRRSLNNAIQLAIQNNHIVRLEEGCFDTDAGRNSRPATYGIKWSSTSAYPDLSSKRIPDESEMAMATPLEVVQKGYRFDKELPAQKRDRGLDATPPVQKRVPDRFKIVPGDLSNKDTASGSDRSLETVQEGHPERFKNDTDIEITPINKTSKNTSKQQQTADAEKALLRLLEEGFDKGTAKKLITAYPPPRILVQCEALAKRNPNRNKLGLLRKSIEEDWPLPDAYKTEQRGAVFASHFYAAWAGNDGQPASSAVATDIAAAEAFAQELLAHYPHEDKLARMARSFGTFVRDREQSNPNMPRSFKLALTRHGDDFVIDFKRKVHAAGKKKLAKAQRAHFESQRDRYQEYLEETESKLRNEQPLVYSAFESDEAEQRRVLVESPFFSSDSIRQESLSSFDSHEERLKRFYSFFEKADGIVLDFWSWDKQLNPDGFGREAKSA